MYKIAFTGHRPSSNPSDSKLCGMTYKDMWTHEFSKEFISQMEEYFIDKINKYENITVITGGALGIDQLAHQAALNVKNKGYNITTIIAVPCRNHSSKWPESSRKKYDELLSKADQVIIVTDTSYNSTCMQERNIWMVNHCDTLVAVWNGSSGGTSNCVKYAKSVKKPIYYIEPDSVIAETE